MPSKNRIKLYAPDTYYHAYNRGVAKQDIFRDKRDYSVFLNLLKRYLDLRPTVDNRGREYEHLRGRIELLAFCLMPNHFHLFFYVIEPKVLARIVQGVCTSYTMYFNKKYKRVGRLFQDVYKAKDIRTDEYLLHITRYIHMNPDNYRAWEPSSLAAYLGKQKIGWLQPEKITDLFKDVQEYSDFLDDYKDYQQTLDDIKAELADN